MLFAMSDTDIFAEGDDTTPVRIPQQQSDDPHLALMSPSELQELFKQDSSERIDLSGKSAADIAAVQLACLALRQAGQWGPPAYDVEVAHPRFAEAVEVAASADNERQALAAATAVLEAPEALAFA